MEPQFNILVVDDDLDIRTLLAEYLENNGCKALMAADGQAMWEMLAGNQVDLVVLDLSLPGQDGLELCRELRTRSSMPVIMLTARSEPLDRILGLEMGADDYLGKPFEPRELLSRIRSVLRRVQGLADNQVLGGVTHMLFSGWTLDVALRHLINSRGVVVSLSGAEFRLLKMFLDHPNVVLNRDQILSLTQGRAPDPFDRSIDLQVSRLRRKLVENPQLQQIIKTVRNEGYILATRVKLEKRT